jgi:signal peptidase II
MPAAVALVVMIVAFVIVLMLTIATWRRSWWRFGGASLMLAGATSNLIDRLAHQYIIDYFYFGQHWPVFNIADVIIVVGLGLYLIRRTSTRPVDKFRLPV